MPRRLAPDKIALLRQAYERGERVMEAARLACRGKHGPVEASRRALSLRKLKPGQGGDPRRRHL